ncbi:MAG TPA: bacteriophage holin [Bdellovibrionota bacterium]|nr:bacteriophage holin [Bdellovibrionota bacterium]
MKLNIRAFALAGGVFWGLSMLLMTLFVLLFKDGQSVMLSEFGTFYIGYSISYVGAIIGLVWGFVDGFICGAIFSWFYNRFLG